MNPRRCAAALGSTSLVIAITACGPGPAIPNNASLRFVNPAAVTLNAGTAANVRISVTGSKAVISEAGRLPDGLTFREGQDGKAMLAGTIGSKAGGRYAVALTASSAGRHASQQLVLTVDQQPAFIPGDTSTMIAWTSKHNEIPVLATGYPAPALTETGHLQPGMSFRSIPGGAALISGSPGFIESPCTSHLTLRASNSSGSATMQTTVHLKNLRCAFGLSTILSLLKGTLQIGPKIFKYGKVAGQWIVQGGKKVGQFIFRRGNIVAVEEDLATAEEGE